MCSELNLKSLAFPSHGLARMRGDGMYETVVLFSIKSR